MGLSRLLIEIYLWRESILLLLLLIRRDTPISMSALGLAGLSLLQLLLLDHLLHERIISRVAHDTLIFIFTLSLAGLSLISLVFLLLEHLLLMCVVSRPAHASTRSASASIIAK